MKSRCRGRVSVYGAILWGRSLFKVIEDAQTMLKRAK